MYTNVEYFLRGATIDNIGFRRIMICNQCVMQKYI